MLCRKLPLKFPSSAQSLCSLYGDSNQNGKCHRSNRYARGVRIKQSLRTVCEFGFSDAYCWFGSQAGEKPPKHIPTFLPAFPDPHTYMHTPTFTGRADNAAVDKIQAHEQRMHAENALLNLHTRIVAANGGDEPGPDSLKNRVDKVPVLQLVKEEQEAAIKVAGEHAKENPFLKAPKGTNDELSGLQAKHEQALLASRSLQQDSEAYPQRPASPTQAAVLKLEEALLERAEKEELVGKPSGSWTEATIDASSAIKQSLYTATLANTQSIWTVDSKRKRPSIAERGVRKLF